MYKGEITSTETWACPICGSGWQAVGPIYIREGLPITRIRMGTVLGGTMPPGWYVARGTGAAPDHCPDCCGPLLACWAPARGQALRLAVLTYLRRS